MLGGAGLFRVVVACHEFRCVGVSVAQAWTGVFQCCDFSGPSRKFVCGMGRFGGDTPRNNARCLGVWSLGFNGHVIAEGAQFCDTFAEGSVCVLFIPLGSHATFRGRDEKHAKLPVSIAHLEV